MANPFKPEVEVPLAFRETEDDMRARCEEQNSREEAWSRSIWMYVSHIDDVPHIIRAEGFDAEEVRAMAHGNFPIYVGWTEERTNQHMGLVRYRLRMGMTAASWEAFAERLPRIRQKWIDGEPARMVERAKRKDIP